GAGGGLGWRPGRLERSQREVDFREHAAGRGTPYAPPTVEVLPPIAGAPAGHEELYRDLARALAGSSPPIAPGSEAIVALELANAIIYSSLTGAEVTLPLDPAAYLERLDSLRRRSGASG